MNETANMIADATRRILRELADPRATPVHGESNQLWNSLETAGLTRTWIPEAQDGAGASHADGFEVVRIAGEFALDVPLAESLLAGWLLQQAGISLPPGASTVAPVDIRDRIVVDVRGRLSGAARCVPFARQSSQIAIFAMRDEQAMVALVDRGLCRIQERANLAGEGRDAISLQEVVPSAIAPVAMDFDALMLMGAALRCMQMAGALQGVLDLSVAYANERVAFEKPIGKFQAIQHSLAKLAGEAAAALAAAGSAADAIDSAAGAIEPAAHSGAVFFEVASAKIRIGEAAAAAAAIAHQVHGAIGFSQEHVLHRYTHRLWSWRDDFGSESYWALRLGQLVARNGADALWPMLAAR
jgi:acyl-CoA dehydrogenase